MGNAALHDFQMERVLGEWRTTAPTIVLVGAPDFAWRMRCDAQGAGLRPICARDASDALEAIMHEKPAMVLVDRALSDVEREWLLARLGRSPWLARIPLAFAST